MRRPLTIAILAIAAAGLLSPPATAKTYQPSEESRMLSLVNQVRATVGQRPLAMVDQMVSIARAQSDRMADVMNIYHNPNLGADLTAHGLPWERAGENVGMGPNMDNIHRALLDSPGHYANIIGGSYNAIGIGITRADDGFIFITQVFAQLRSLPSQPAPAPEAPAPPAPPPPAPPAPLPARTAPPPPTPPPPTPEPAPPTPEPNVVNGGVLAQPTTDTEEDASPGPSFRVPEETSLPETLGARLHALLTHLLDVLVFWS